MLEAAAKTKRRDREEISSRFDPTRVICSLICTLSSRCKESGCGVADLGIDSMVLPRAISHGAPRKAARGACEMCYAYRSMIWRLSLWPERCLRALSRVTRL